MLSQRFKGEWRNESDTTFCSYVLDLPELYFIYCDIYSRIQKALLLLPPPTQNVS
jgi:hypothetical protein